MTSGFKLDIHFCCDFYSKLENSFSKWGALHVAAVTGLRKSCLAFSNHFVTEGVLQIFSEMDLCLVNIELINFGLYVWFG
jgi:hypothetical protein